MKLKEILHDDFTDYSGISDDLAGFAACFFCLGVSSVGMSEARYRRITYDFTLAAAGAVAKINPGLVFCSSPARVRIARKQATSCGPG